MAAAKQLAQLMGGEIGVESVPGKGLAFWFFVPFDRQAVDAPCTASVSVHTQKVRVLVVDDNATNREIVHHQLTARAIDNCSKPFTQEQLGAVLEHWLPRRLTDVQAVETGSEPAATPPASSTAHQGAGTPLLDPKVLDKIRALQRLGAPDLLGRVVERYLEKSPQLLQTQRAGKTA